jgi:hypothetical protein
MARNLVALLYYCVEASGMLVFAEANLGSRMVMEYLLSPVKKW